jgi:hypothetical protein
MYRHHVSNNWWLVIAELYQLCTERASLRRIVYNGLRRLCRNRDTWPAATMDPDSKPHRRSRTDCASAEFQEQHSRAPPLRAKDTWPLILLQPAWGSCADSSKTKCIFFFSPICADYSLCCRRVKLRYYYSSFGGIVNEIIGKTRTVRFNTSSAPAWTLLGEHAHGMAAMQSASALPKYKGLDSRSGSCKPNHEVSRTATGRCRACREHLRLLGRVGRPAPGQRHDRFRQPDWSC